jgi:hypothetical protein
MHCGTEESGCEPASAGVPVTQVATPFESLHWYPDTQPFVEQSPGLQRPSLAHVSPAGQPLGDVQVVVPSATQTAFRVSQA